MINELNNFEFNEVIKKVITPEDIQEIYEEATDSVGQHVSGNDYAYLCPFHEDTKPTLTVNISPDKFGIYNCFACKTKQDGSELYKGNLQLIIERRIQDDYQKYLMKKLDLTKARILSLHKKMKNSKVKVQKEPEKKELPPIDPDVILKKKKYFQQHRIHKQYFLDRQINEKQLDVDDIGYDPVEKRYWIPIKENGQYVNVRKYDPFAKKSEAKMLNMKGRGRVRLWPMDVIQMRSEVYIFEGEKDRLVAAAAGLPAVTGTGGCNTWLKEWNPLFKNKTVYICYDIDQAGIDSAKMVAENIYPYAAQVKIIDLARIMDSSVHKKGDFCDFINDCGHAIEEFLSLVEETKVFIEDIELEKEDKKDIVLYKTTLSEAAKPNYRKKHCEIKNVRVIGGDDSPYSAPKKVRFMCRTYKDGIDTNNKNINKRCQTCALNMGPFEKTFAPYDYDLVELIDVTNSMVKGKMKQITQIFCPSMVYEELEHYSVERLRLSPNISFNMEEKFQHVIRVGLYIYDKDAIESKEVEKNKAYNIKAISINDPKTQYILHQIYDVEIAATDVSAFELTPEIDNMLQVFRPKAKQTVDDVLEERYKELSVRMGLHGREDMIRLMDLSYFSIINFEFQGRPIDKGWVETAIIGDSGQAKSTIARFLGDFYKAGDFIDGESVSVAGLKGSVQQINRAWQIQWGRLPQNDGRLVIIDEAGGLSHEDISQLSSIRSSGICDIQKVRQDSTRSRTRIVWLGNVKGKYNNTIKRYAQGVRAILDFFGATEDVRRVDLAMTVASGEVSPELMNSAPEEIKIYKYLPEAFKALLSLAWQSTAKNVFITKEAEKAIIANALDLSKKYSSVIPLIEPSVMRLKLARLAVSTAVLVYSYDTKKKQFVIKKEHVDSIVRFINYIYTKPTFRYDEFSELEFAKTLFTKEQEDKVYEILNLHEYAYIQEITETGFLTKEQISTLMCTDMRDQDFLNRLYELKRLGAITINDYTRKIMVNPALKDYALKLRDEYRAKQKEKPKKKAKTEPVKKGVTKRRRKI